MFVSRYAAVFIWKKQEMKNHFKIIIAFLLVIVVNGVPTNVIFALTAKEQQRAALQQQQAQALAQANQKAAEAAQMKTQISVVTNQINQTQAALDQTNGGISSTQATIDDLTSQITVQEAKLADEKNKLNQVISSWYMEGSVGFFETLFSSNSLSSMVSKQQYYDSIKLQVTSTIAKVNDLKAQLAAQKSDQQKKMTDLQSLQQQQTSYKTSVVNQKNLQTQMLNMTQAQQQQYLALVSKLQGEISSISAQIYAERSKSHWNESIVYGSTSYPFSGIDEPDPWDFLTRECTSYAAWYWNVKLGKDWTNTQPGRGSARYWPELARTQGYSVSQTPRVGAIVSWYGPLYSGDQWGHVAIVEAVNSDGTIDLSEYNWTKYAYDYRKNVSPGNYGS